MFLPCATPDPYELEAQAALAGAGLGHDAHDLSVACVRLLERLLEHRHVVVAPDEPGEPAGTGHVEARLELAHALELVHLDRSAHALHGGSAQVSQPDVAPDQLCGRLAHAGRAGPRELLHALREPDRETLGGVVHAQVVPDLAHHHLARVDADAHGEVEALGEAQLVGVALERIAQVQRCVAGAPRVVLVGDRRAEERHDAVSGVLVDGALEAVDALREDLEEALEDRVPGLGIHLLRQLQRLLDVGEQHRDLLALALQRRLGPKDAVDEMLRGVVAGGASRCPPFPNGDPGDRTGGVTLLGSRSEPGQDLALERGHLLNVHQLLDECLGLVVAQLELELQSPQGDPALLAQQLSGPPDRLEEAQEPSSDGTAAPRLPRGFSSRQEGQITLSGSRLEGRRLRSGPS